MWGKRNKEQLYEYGRVTVVNTNGTLDVLIPGRAHPYKELPSLIDPRIHRVGMSVVVGKAYGNPYMPFVIGDLRSYKTVRASDFVPVRGVYLYAWSCYRSNPKQNFLSGYSGIPIDIDQDAEVVRASYKMDEYTKNGPVIGMVRYQALIGPVDEEENLDIIGVKNYPGIWNGTTGYRDEYYAIPPYQIIDEDDDYFFESRIEDLVVSGTDLWCPKNGTGSWLYCEFLNQLICIKMGWNLYGPSEKTEIVIMDGSCGNLPGGTSILGGDYTSAIARIQKPYIIEDGNVIYRDKLIKTFVTSDASLIIHDYSTETTTFPYASENNGDNKYNIVCLELSDSSLDKLWHLNLNSIWNGTDTIPFKREITPHFVINPPFTAAYYHTYQNINLYSPVQWSKGIPNNCLLPGSPGVVLEDLDFLVMPIIGREVYPYDVYYWQHSVYPSMESRYRIQGMEYVWPTVNNYSTYAPIGWMTCSPYIYAPGNWPGSLFVTTSLIYWVGNFNFVDSLPAASSKLNMFLAFIELDAASENIGKVSHKYEFEELNISDNYIIDYDSFGKVSNFMPTKISNTVSYMSRTVSRISGSAEINYNFSLTFSTDIISPDQFTIDQITVSGGPLPSAITHTSTMTHNGNFLTDYMFWPPNAGYRLDPIISYPTQSSQVNIVADSNNDIYFVYLKPFVILSCASPFVINDESLADRISPASTVFDSDWSHYQSDRLTPKPDMIHTYMVHYNSVGIETGTPGDLGATHTVNTQQYATLYGVPTRFFMYKSFMVKINSAAEKEWEKELTTYMDERLDNSPGLSGQLPYPGCTLRIIPTSVGVFVLRLVRLPIKTSLREIAYFPQYRSHQSTNYNNTYPTMHYQNTLNSKAIIELRDSESGDVIWEREIFDPTSIADSWMCACSMVGSESPSGGAWVVGRVDYSKDYSADVLWINSPQDFGAGLFRVSKVFSAHFIEGDDEPTITIRNAFDGDNEDEYNDIGSNGVWPHDWINDFSRKNGLLRQDPIVLMDGTLHYPAERPDLADIDKYDIYGYGRGIPPV